MDVAYCNLLPYIFSFLAGFIILFPGLKTIGIDLPGLNVSPHELPHFVRRFILCCIILIELLISAPPASMQMSSANPKPFVVPELIICIALSNAMIQNFAEHTPPCGNPIPIVRLPS